MSPTWRPSATDCSSVSRPGMSTGSWSMRRAVQIHVFTVGSIEVDRMLLFRDRLRSCAADRELYQRTKRELAAARWAYVQDYADAKTSVVEDILARARDDGR